MHLTRILNINNNFNTYIKNSNDYKNKNLIDIMRIQMKYKPMKQL